MEKSSTLLCRLKMYQKSAFLYTSLTKPRFEPRKRFLSISYIMLKLYREQEKKSTLALNLWTLYNKSLYACS
jgi:hypothetical protein